MIELKLKGFSHFDVYINQNIFKNTVIKKAKNNSDYQKLKRQIIIQNNFETKIKKIKTPQILDTIKNGFVMTYIDGYAFYEFFTYSDNIYAFFNIITSFIDENIKNSKMINFTRNFEEKIISKYSEIIKNKVNLNRKDDINKYYKYLIKFINDNDIILPSGVSHGDLTLSNILFDLNNIYFIDFLDNFINTPFQDIIKLRQDTQFLWSYKLNKALIDCKLNDSDLITLKKNLQILDKLIHGYYKNDDFYAKYYNFYQIFNFFRILPYSKDLNELDMILDMMNQIK
jgi:tRNA A-37 threonylcarbamoyl transferase component Bud32